MVKFKIMQANNTFELEQILEQAAADRNCELDNSLSYGEQADFLREEAQKGGNGAEDMADLAELLGLAEQKWFELEVL